MVIKDSNGKVFGGFASDEWRSSSNYYGNGDAFVFSFVEKDGKEVGVGEDYGELQVTIHPWTSQNNYIMYSDEKILAMGGGGRTAIVVESDFLRGASQSGCPTFGSLCLSSTEDFIIDCLEVWSFDIWD